MTDPRYSYLGGTHGPLPPDATLNYLDSDGQPVADHDTATRFVIVAGGRVRTQLDYTDDDGNTATIATATQCSHILYDVNGDVVDYNPATYVGHHDDNGDRVDNTLPDYDGVAADVLDDD